MNRYEIGGDLNDEFEPGSNNLVLRNRLGITDPLEMGLIESEALDLAYKWSFDRFEITTHFGLNELKEMHLIWLGDIYEFAGKIRTVNISKGGILFTPLEYLQQSCEAFDSHLRAQSPCCDLTDNELLERIARVHGEFLLLHPFREGNGRVARWLADLMCLQSGKPLISWDFASHDDLRREEYFSAVRKSFLLEFNPLIALLRDAIHNDQS